MKRTLRLAAVVAGLTVLPAAAASAHPSLDPNRVPTGEAVETDLVVPHGCSTGESVVPDAGESVPTVEFALQKVDGVTVEPGPVDGWEVAEEDDAWVWTDAGGATSDPITFPITLTAEGEAGDELQLAAFQACEDGSTYRWTADSEATPAVHLELTAGETGTAEMDTSHHGDGASEDAHGSGHATEHASEDGHAAEDGGHASELDGEDGTAAAGATALEGEAADDGIDIGIVGAVVAVVLLLVGGLVAVARGKQAT